MDMTRSTFERALDWAAALNDRRDETRNELSLTGIGEALLHPDFVEFVALARKRLPAGRIVFSTNGLLLDDAMCERLAPHRPRIYVSLHRPEKAGPAIFAAKRHGIFEMANPAPALSPMNWAGQVNVPYASAPPITCDYLKLGWGVVLVDGRITTCCIDASGAGVVGHVDDPIESLTSPGTGLSPYGLCKDCHMQLPA